MFEIGTRSFSATVKSVLWIFNTLFAVFSLFVNLASGFSRTKDSDNKKDQANLFINGESEQYDRTGNTKRYIN